MAPQTYRKKKSGGPDYLSFLQCTVFFRFRSQRFFRCFLSHIFSMYYYLLLYSFLPVKSFLKAYSSLLEMQKNQ